MTINLAQAIPLSRDIVEEDKEFLTKEVIDEKLFDVLKQINPLKAQSPDGLRAIIDQKR